MFTSERMRLAWDTWFLTQTLWCLTLPTWERGLGLSAHSALRRGSVPGTHVQVVMDFQNLSQILIRVLLWVTVYEYVCAWLLLNKYVMIHLPSLPPALPLTPPGARARAVCGLRTQR